MKAHLFAHQSYRRQVRAVVAVGGARRINPSSFGTGTSALVRQFLSKEVLSCCTGPLHFSSLG